MSCAAGLNLQGEVMITDKMMYFEAAEKLAFGNQLRRWSTLQEYMDSGHFGLVGLRVKKQSGGLFILTNTAELESNYERALGRGYAKEEIAICEGAPHDLLTIQGEVDDRFNLTYSTAKTDMRTALRSSCCLASGLQARVLLKGRFDPSSYEDLLAVFERYPDHVVEFSAFSTTLGVIPSRNVVVWEVRRY